MKRDFQIPTPLAGPVSRRDFLSDLGLGFTGLSLGAMLFEDGIAKAAASAPTGTPPDGQPHFAPKTKAVIWIFLSEEGAAGHPAVIPWALSPRIRRPWQPHPETTWPPVINP